MGVDTQTSEPTPPDKQPSTQDGLPPEGYRVHPSKYPWVTPVVRLLLNPASQPMPYWLQSYLARWSKIAQRPLTQPEIDALVYYQVKSINPQEILPTLGSLASLYHTVRTAAEYRLPFRTDVVLRQVGFPWPAAERGVRWQTRPGILFVRLAAYTTLWGICADRGSDYLVGKIMKDGLERDERLRDLDWSSRVSEKHIWR